jgi:hypothetical protein
MIAQYKFEIGALESIIDAKRQLDNSLNGQISRIESLYPRKALSIGAAFERVYPDTPYSTFLKSAKKEEREKTEEYKAAKKEQAAAEKKFTEWKASNKELCERKELQRRIKSEISNLQKRIGVVSGYIGASLAPEEEHGVVGSDEDDSDVVSEAEVPVQKKKRSAAPPEVASSKKTKTKH